MNYESFTTSSDWNQYFLSQLKQKGYEDSINVWESERGTFRFVHFSPRIEELISAGEINISGGGLMGAVYVTPIRSDGTVHNLGQYIFDTEIPQSRNEAKTDCLVFELTREQFTHSLQHGKFNYIFASKLYIDQTTEQVTPKEYLEVFNGIDALLEIKESEVFLKKAMVFFQTFPSLKHVYFETLNEYLYTRQDSGQALEALRNGEIYAKAIKDYLFSVTPKLKTSFSTTHFEVDSFLHIKNLSEDTSIIYNFDSKDFVRFTKHRIRFYLLQLKNEPDALLGRMLLKIAQSEQRLELEQYGADRLQSLLAVTLYQYDTIPKGEMGVTSLNEVTSYRGEYRDGQVELRERVDIKINSKLGGGHHSVLRVKS